VGSLVVPEEDVRRLTAWNGGSDARPAPSFFDFDGLVERWEKYGAEGFGWYDGRFSW
jgi:hypothetical protein